MTELGTVVTKELKTTVVSTAGISKGIVYTGTGTNSSLTLTPDSMMNGYGRYEVIYETFPL